MCLLAGFWERRGEKKSIHSTISDRCENTNNLNKQNLLRRKKAISGVMRPATPKPPKKSSGSNSSPNKNPSADVTNDDDIGGKVAVQQKSSTRVCIKQLPPTMTEEKLKRHLMTASGTSGTTISITDCRILKTKSGKSRNICYVGFKEASMALSVISYFHNSFVQSNRISVEHAFLPTTTSSDINKDSTAIEPSSSSSHRPWSKYSVGSSQYAKLHPDEINTSTAQTIEEITTATTSIKTKTEEELERKKNEFLAVMQPRSKSKAWSNDDDYAGVLAATSYNDNNKAKKLNEMTSTDGKQQHDEASSSESDNDDYSIQGSTENNNKDDNNKPTVISKPKMSNMDFLRSKVIAKDELSEEDEDDDQKKVTEDEDKSTSTTSSSSSSDSSSSSSSKVTDINETNNTKNMKKGNRSTPTAAASANPEATTQGIVMIEGEGQQQADAGTSTSSTNNNDPARLFVRNLPFSTTVEDLREVFQPFGTIVDVHIPLDDLKRNKGYAFIRYEAGSDGASAAIAKLDGTDFQGRLMHIIAAKKAINTTAVDDTATTYKSKKEAERKANATTATGWNASFVRGDTVVEGLANRLGLYKSDILNVTDGSSGDAAVRLALGETHIINENLEYFSFHGIDMTTLLLSNNNNNKRRSSSTMILVKNLPFSTTQEELMKLFTTVDNNSPTEILLPPSRAVAIIKYLHENEAKGAFRKLAYKRFKNVPLYLEWAPLSAFSSSIKKDSGNTAIPTLEVSSTTTSGSTSGVNTITSTRSTTIIEDDDEEDTSGLEEGVAHSVYVKNLNFSSNEESLKKMFEKVVKVRSVRIPTKAVPQKHIKGSSIHARGEIMLLSMGFGFVECNDASDAKKVIKELQGKNLDGHALELTISSHASPAATTVSSSSSSKRKTTTKLMIRNVPFEATRTELLKLFGSFGQLKNVRMPKKFDGNHRGFAFIDYVSSEDAQNAMVKLSRTHLYGRHLVLEWSEDKDDIDTLREKAKRDLHQKDHHSTAIGSATVEPKNKKIRFDS